jgi:hypothetical protein
MHAADHGTAMPALAKTSHFIFKQVWHTLLTCHPHLPTWLTTSPKKSSLSSKNYTTLTWQPPPVVHVNVDRGTAHGTQRT